MKEIPLTQGKHAIVDDEDFPYLSRFRWYTTGNGNFAKRDIEADRHGPGKGKVAIHMHSLLVYCPAGSMIVHRNNNGLDNRKENLVAVHLRHVIHHRPKNSKGKTSKYKGVCWDTQVNRWRAEITIPGGKRLHLGRSFKTEEAAARVYNEKALELYGDLAYQNEIPAS